MAGASSLLLSFYLEVNRTTVSKWNTNFFQPSIKQLDKIGDLLEIDNSELLLSNNRINTGLAKAAQKEFKRLINDGAELYIQIKDENGGVKDIPNPELVKKIQKFVEDYKRKTKKKK